ncbi:MAG TPA: ABC transporter substrate-binding protein [bacterium]|nr:ABC transporter substrate-binding protein [bacterium]
MGRDRVTLFTQPMTRRTLLKGGGTLALAMTGGQLAGLLPPAHAQGMLSLSEQLGWLANAQMAGDFVATSKGYFKDAGIDLKIQPGGPNIDAVQVVAGGGIPMGNVSSVAVLVNARSHGLPVKAFATALQKHPFAFIFLTKSGIRTPRDFAGKTIGIQATARPLLEAVLAKYQIPPDKVKVLFVGGDTHPLVTGQVDVITGWIIDAPQIAAVRQAGSYSYFPLWDLGIRLYAYTYFTTDKMLSERKDALVRFTAASAKGWLYAAQHPDEAADIVIKSTTGLDRTLELQTWKNEIPYMFSPLTKQAGWGAMDPKVWTAISDTYYGLKQIPQAVPATDVMTTEIVEMAKTPKV